MMNSLRDTLRARQLEELHAVRHRIANGEHIVLDASTVRDLLANWPRDRTVSEIALRALHLPPSLSLDNIHGLLANASAIPLGYRLEHHTDACGELHLAICSPLATKQTPTWVLSHAIRAMHDGSRFDSRHWLGIEQLRRERLTWWVCGSDGVWQHVQYSFVDSHLSRADATPPRAMMFEHASAF